MIDTTDAPDGETRPVDRVAVLLERISRGDDAAFARLYDMLASRVFGLILRVVGDRAASEAVLTAAFEEVWRSAALYSPDSGDGKAWVLALVHRRATHRARDTRADAEPDLFVEGRRVAAAMSALPDLQREVISLAYYAGFDRDEIAAHLGVSPLTVAAQLREALTRLRAELGAA